MLKWTWKVEVDLSKKRLIEHFFLCSHNGTHEDTVDSLSRLPSISLSRTKSSVPWNFSQEHCITFLYFKIPYLELFPILNNFLVSWTIFSLYLKHLHIRISFPNSRINSNLNQNKNFDRKWKKIRFLFSLSSKQKCQT